MRRILVLIVLLAVGSAAKLILEFSGLTEEQKTCVLQQIDANIDDLKEQVSNMLATSTNSSDPARVLISGVPEFLEKLKKQAHDTFQDVSPSKLNKLKNLFNKSETLLEYLLLSDAENLPDEVGGNIMHALLTLTDVVPDDLELIECFPYDN